ncbi:MAG: acyl-ACP--UDP-N-acetylglucosamine O-acyltransferase, partial [Nitrospinota bacterium]
MLIDPTAIIDTDAQVARDVRVGPFCVIGKNTVIGEGVEIASHVTMSHSEVGSGCKIGTGAVLGGAPQILGTGDVESFVQVGDGSFLGEYVSVHRAGREGGRTVIGKNNYIMAFTHIAHDCHTENDVVLTSYTGLSGHVEVGEGAVIGGQTGVHQFVKIGKYSMIGGMSRVVKDVMPFYLVEGNPAVLRGLNRVGLNRKNF